MRSYALAAMLHIYTYIDTVDLEGPHRDRFVQRVDESYSMYAVVQQGMLLSLEGVLYHFLNWNLRG